MKSMFRLSFFGVLFALLTVGAVAQTPCVEGTHYTKSFIIHNGKPYHVLTFTNTSVECQWSVPQNTSNLEYLVVAGGGSGGSVFNDWEGCGGGGAGGLLQGTISNSPSTLALRVGTGGVAPSTTGSGVNGNNSYITGVGISLTAVGGGGGGRFKVTGKAGGSGGGGGGRISQPGGAATSGQGFAGGIARSSDPQGRVAGGGGGGAGAVGGNGDQNGGTVAGNGGSGLSHSITGVATLYAGGGGGGAYDDYSGETPGIGGTGGGGAGSSIGNATAGTHGLGGGGGGAGRNGFGGNGGNGTVIIRYNDEISLNPNATVGAGISYEGNGLFISAGLTVDANKVLYVEPGTKLVVEGDVVNNGTIVLQSNGSGTLYGQLKWSGNYSGSGNVTVQKYLNSDWNLLAVGKSGASPSYFGTVATDPTKPSEANLYEWNGSNFMPVFSSGSLDASKGYLAFVGSLGVKPSAGVYDFTGTPVSELTFANALHGNSTSAISSVAMYGGGPLDGTNLDRKGWNLLANPFTADLRVFDLTRSNLANSFYLRNSNGGYSAVAMAGIESEVVPPLSAFWVKATSNAAPTINSGTAGKVQFTTTLKAPTFAPSSNGSPVLMRTSNGSQSWDKAFVTVIGEISGKGERQGITERGFVYGISTAPVIGGSGVTKVASGSGTGVFSSTIAGLNTSTTYYVRPYATSPSGTTYGTQFTVSTPATFTCGTHSVSFSYNGSTITYGTIWRSGTGECWMDRNLGASQLAYSMEGLNSGSDAIGGHYFQWGRSADGHQVINSAVTQTKYSTLSPTTSNFVEETNWTTASLTATNPWEGLYAENNPCPLGWRVPSGNEWDNERNSWNSITHNYTNPGGSQVSMTTRDPNSGFSNLKLRMSTIRSGSPNSTYWPNTNYQGRLQSKITTGYTLYPQSLYWTSRLVDGSNASVLQVTTGAYDVSSYDYSNYTQSAVGNGAFVRCIRSDGYNTNTQAFD